MRDSRERFDDEKIWSLLEEYDEHDALITASVSNKAERIDKTLGIVEGHTYTVKKVVTVGGKRLLNIRNPWGSFEWTGAWGDNSDEWKRHSDIAKKLEFEPGDDGIFWSDSIYFFLHFISAILFCVFV